MIVLFIEGGLEVKPGIYKMPGFAHSTTENYQKEMGMPIQTARFNSHCIQSCTYDSKAQRLVVTFTKSGATDTIEKVDQATYDRFRNAESQGRFFNENFRKSR